MDADIFKPLITALPTLIAVILGGLVTYLSASKMKKIEFLQSKKMEDIRENKLLFTSFLKITNEATSSFYLDKSADHTKYLPVIVSELSRIELFSSEEVYIKANALASHITSLILDDSEPKSNLSNLRTEFIKSVKLELEKYA